MILGSTGSIGTQALEVIEGSDELRAVGLAAGRGWETTVEQARRHGVAAIALADRDAAARAGEAWDGQVLAGEEGVRELIGATEPDLVLNAIVGAAGLASTVVALTAGIDVALAHPIRAGRGVRPGDGTAVRTVRPAVRAARRHARLAVRRVDRRRQLRRRRRGAAGHDRPARAGRLVRV